MSSGTKIFKWHIILVLFIFSLVVGYSLLCMTNQMIAARPLLKNLYFGTLPTPRHKEVVEILLSLSWLHWSVCRCIFEYMEIRLF